MVHGSFLHGPSHNRWNVTACRMQLTGCPPLAGCRMTLAESQCGCWTSLAREESHFDAWQPPAWTITQQMACDCMPQATHMRPPTCKLPNDAGRITIWLLDRFLQGRSHSVAHGGLLHGPAHNTWHVTACHRQLTGSPPLAGCRMTLAESESGCWTSPCKGGVTMWCMAASCIGQHTTDGM